MIAALSPSRDILRALAEAASLVTEARDVLLGRLTDDQAPSWAQGRGWAEGLLSLSDEALAFCEREGLSRCPEPLAPSLVALAERARRAASVPTLAPVLPLDRGWITEIPGRKRDQVAAMLAAVAPLAARASRIVDVGAGRGHFTRLAADAFDTEALGLEREPQRVASAERLAAGTGRARFETFDADSAPIALAADDLAVGLHACGDLGDRLVVAAARSGASLALLSCCPQKIRAKVREPLSSIGGRAGLVLPREALGLANLSAREQGVEVSLDRDLEARRARFALSWWLRERGQSVAPGEEMRGQNRRRARKGLAAIAPQAFAMRGLPIPTEAEIAEVDEASRRRFARVRRLTLPRTMLAPVVEVAIVLDRAARLVEASREVTVLRLCDASVTPRNLVLLASGAR